MGVLWNLRGRDGSFSVNDVARQLPTLAGETAEEVASNIADTINADNTLSQAGIFAFATGSTVITNGLITDRIINAVALPPDWGAT